MGLPRFARNDTPVSVIVRLLTAAEAIPAGEILNPKHEILNNIKTQNTKAQDV
jgi:hypothetical protein